MTKKLALIGGGGHALSLLDILPSSEKAAGYVDCMVSNHMPLQYIGDDDQFISGCVPDDWRIIITLVSGRSCNLKKRNDIIAKYSGYESPVIIAASAIVSPTAVLHDGTAAFHRAVINAQTIIGRHCVINTGAIIEHECNVGNNVFIGPGAIICGGVNIGDNSYIGAGAIIKPGISICKGSIIGAGATVVKNINAIGTYTGVPATELKNV